MLNNMQKWFIIVLSVFILNIGKSIAQSSISAKITGTVTDGLTDLPVEFVTVYLKGSSNAVETDASGRYNINVPAQKPFVLVHVRTHAHRTRARARTRARTRVQVCARTRIPPHVRGVARLARRWATQVLRALP